MLFNRFFRGNFRPQRYVSVFVCIACTARESSSTVEHSQSKFAHYTPRVRDITITTVPLLVKEEQEMLPFLKKDFAGHGVLEGKEVYAFSPSSVTVVEGDTIHVVTWQLGRTALVDIPTLLLAVVSAAA